MVDTIDHPLREAVQRRRTLTFVASLPWDEQRARVFD